MKKIIMTAAILLGLLSGQSVWAELSKDERVLLECTIENLKDCVKKSLDKDTNIGFKDDLYGDTLLHWAVRLGHYNIMKTLIEHDADIIDSVNDSGETPLYYAVKTQHHTQHYYALRILIEFDADVNVANKDGIFPLHLVASRGHVNAVEMLIEAGADLEAISPNRFTALQLAIRHGEQAAETVQLLLDAGAKVDGLGQLAHANMIEILKTTQTNLL